MKKSELIERMVEKEGMSRKYATNAVDAMLTAITEGLKRGESITLPGFGTFSVKERAEHQGRNPQTGEIMTFAARRVPVFKPGRGLKEVVASFTSQSLTRTEKAVK